jgi:ADP-heptose:LPS heptosyltransferase
LVRPRFEGAVEGLVQVDEVLTLPTQSILAPIIDGGKDVKQSLRNISEFIEALRLEAYDLVINCSFSPMSSYLTHAIAAPETKVLGYSRYEDGFLQLSDPISGYFYAQVGVQRYNRVHLSEIFASMMDVDLIPEDWSSPRLGDFTFHRPQNYVVVHVGASAKEKTLGTAAWSEVIRQVQSRVGWPIVLIGSADETLRANEIAQACSGCELVNLVGRTRIQDLFSVMKYARAFIGGDSAPVHIASLTQTPTINVSMPSVNFWETGPRAPGSFVVPVTDESAPILSRIANLAVAATQGRVAANLSTGEPIFQTINETAGYRGPTSRQDDFSWALTLALYTGSAYPILDDYKMYVGFEKIREANEMILEQLDKVGVHRDTEKLGSVIERGDDVIEAISKMVPHLRPLTWFYQSMKINIGPGEFDDVLEKTLDAHLRLHEVLAFYKLEETTGEASGNTGGNATGEGLIPAM